jgi:hypothetical protein
MQPLGLLFGVAVVLLRRSQSQLFLSLPRNLSRNFKEYAQKLSKYQIGVFFDA